MRPKIQTTALLDDRLVMLEASANRDGLWSSEVWRSCWVRYSDGIAERIFLWVSFRPCDCTWEILLKVEWYLDCRDQCL
jgi:hypothetical protein